MVNPKNNLADDTDVSFIPMALVSDQYSGNYEYETRKWCICKKGFTHFAEGDIAFAKISPCFENRKSVYFSKLLNGYGAGTTELYVLRSYNTEIDLKYILALLKSEYFINCGKETFSGVVGQQRVDKEIIFNTLIPIPPKSAQNQIIKKVNCVMDHLKQIEAALI